MKPKFQVVQRERFETLRAKYLAACEKRDGLDSTLRARYGGDYQDSWLKAGDRKALDRLRAACDRAGDAFTAHLASFSPRDWSYGVPCHWVRESLMYEDAARPAGEPLGVVPPLSYGATRPRS